LREYLKSEYYSSSISVSSKTGTRVFDTSLLYCCSQFCRSGSATNGRQWRDECPR